MTSEITSEVVDIVRRHAADRWRQFGRTLLQTDTAGIENIISKLSGNDPHAPRSNAEKLKRVLESWIESEDGPTLVQLRTACLRENILGGVEVTYAELSGNSSEQDIWVESLHWKRNFLHSHLCQAVVQNGGSRWRGIGRNILGKSNHQLDDVVGATTITNSQLVEEIIWAWVDENGDDATLSKLKQACREVSILGAVEQELAMLLQ